MIPQMRRMRLKTRYRLSIPSLLLPADASARRSAAQVWEIAVRALRCELSPSINRRYLEPCWLAAFDPNSATFTVGVPAEQDRLWLEDRLAARLTHLLNGICDRSCRVRFEVVGGLNFPNLPQELPRQFAPDLKNAPLTLRIIRIEFIYKCWTPPVPTSINPIHHPYY